MHDYVMANVALAPVAGNGRFCSRSASALSRRDSMRRMQRMVVSMRLIAKVPHLPR
jgi:hypothetical protein